MNPQPLGEHGNEDAASVESLLARAARRWTEGEIDDATHALARAAHALLVSGRQRRAKSVLRRILERGAAHATRDVELFSTCLRFGLGDLGVAFAIRAARALRVSGDAAASEDVLREAERRVVGLGSAALTALAEARAELGPLEKAVRLLVVAAERARREGDAARSVELCLRASHCGVGWRGLQRAWGLALLAWGDPDGARGHLERWCEEEPESVDALLWTLEASWRRRSTAEIGSLLERLAERLDTAGPLEGGEGLRDRVRGYLRGRKAATAELALAPFWEAEDFPWTLPNHGSPSEVAAARRRVLVVEDASFSARLVSRILERWSLEVLTTSEAAGLAPDVGLPDLDLAIVALPGDANAAAARLERIRSHPGLARIPILGVVPLEGSSLDYGRLREFGVMGVVDRGATPEQVAFRIGQATALGKDAARRHVRVPVDLTVELEVGGHVVEERAENLSWGGIRLRSGRPLELNTDVVLRFRLSEQSTETIRAEGRVIHCHPHPELGGMHSAGIFFSSLEPRYRELIEAEIERLLERSVSAPSRASIASE